MKRTSIPVPLILKFCTGPQMVPKLDRKWSRLKNNKWHGCRDSVDLIKTRIGLHFFAILRKIMISATYVTYPPLLNIDISML